MFAMDSTHEFVEQVRDNKRKNEQSKKRQGEENPGEKLPGKQHSTNK